MTPEALDQCPFCGEPLTIFGGCNPGARCDTEGCWMHPQQTEVVEALEKADAAIREMFRYYDGGETRGSYDGKPERAQLRKAGYATTKALAALKGSRP